MRTIAQFFLAFLLSTAAHAASAASAAAPKSFKKEPSANKGKRDKYQCHTSREGYDYWVYVPASYSDDNPAGIHIYFHGQGGQGSAPHFGQWAENFLNTYNLIGINMQYQDGDNAKDTVGKTAAAREAIAQTFADYKIIAGRGVICSFSGGGLPHAVFFKDCSKTRGADWPFCHDAHYSSNYRAPAPAGACAMSWFFSVGEKEWSLANLGSDGNARASELLAAAVKGGDADIYFKVMKGKGHTIDSAEVRESVRGWQRSDLAFAPFLYEPDFTEQQVANVAKQANQLQLNAALTAANGVINGKSAPDDVKKKAQKIKEKIESRAKAIVEVCKDIAGNDPILCAYYGPKFLQQLSGLPEAKEVQQLMQKASSAPNYGRILSYQALFKENMRTFFSGNGALLTSKVAVLEDVKKTAPEKSQVGGMAAEYLLLERAEK